MMQDPYFLNQTALSGMVSVLSPYIPEMLPGRDDHKIMWPLKKKKSCVKWDKTLDLLAAEKCTGCYTTSPIPL